MVVFLQVTKLHSKNKLTFFDNFTQQNINLL